MKLVLIYGPPAVGKLTVAKELVKLTKFKLFHNHLARDLLTSLVGESDKLYRVDIPLRKNLVRYAIKMDVMGLVFTTCYVANADGRKYLRDIANIVEKSGGTVYFVRLKTSRNELITRVTSKDRKKFGKFTDPKKMCKYLDKHDVCDAEFKYKNSLTIDNTNISSKKVAKKIKEYYKL